MHEKANEFYADAFKIEIFCSAQAVEELLSLLKSIQHQGAIGHSADIIIDPDSKDKAQGFFFDGDGSSKIQEIKVKQLYWHDLFRINTNKGMLEKDGIYWKVEENKELEKIQKRIRTIEEVRDKQTKGTCEPNCQCKNNEK